jgi:gamma-glutamyltranspeptidase/glutathione hydrolase
VSTSLVGARTAVARRGMVASAFPAASDAGVEALAAGGNAIDAAVATGFALAVCEPCASGLGGQSVLLIRLASGDTTVLGGWPRAPQGASRTTITREEQRRGRRACVTPTTVGTLAHAHEYFGRLPRARVLAPAIRLAEEGYLPTALQLRQLRWCRRALSCDEGARRFLVASGEVFRQPALAATLRRIVTHGGEDFYFGELARRIVADMRLHGGLLTDTDLAMASAPSIEEPLRLRLGAVEILTAPPPAGGAELVRSLAQLDGRSEQAPRAVAWETACAFAVHDAFAERERAADGRAGQRPGVVQRMSAEPEGETSHLCTADDEGNVVSLTQSIQSLFGAKVAHPELGFFYNNYLRTCPRRRHRNRLAGGAFARSNVAPSIVLYDGRPWLAIGAAGSRRIISSVAQVITAVISHGVDPATAVAAPRVHVRLDQTAWVEREAITPQVVTDLARRGFAVERKARLSFAMGAVQAIAWDGDGSLLGIADGRRDGEPRGF